MEVVVTTGTITLQSNRHHQQINMHLLIGQTHFPLPNQQCESPEGKNCAVICVRYILGITEYNLTEINKKVSYAKRSCISIPCNLQFFLTSSLIIMQNLVAVSRIVCADIASQKFGGRQGPVPWDGGRGWLSRNMLLSHVLAHQILSL